MSEMSSMMRRSLDAVTRRLAGHFRGVFSEETVARYVDDSYAQTGQRSTVGPNFLPVIIERFARERLEAVAQADGLIAKDLPQVLFVCVRNAGRSQMAAALTHQLSDGKIAVRSAGTSPGDRIHPVVVEAMSEVGVDVRMEFPKPLTDEVVRQIRSDIQHHVAELLETLTHSLTP
jgi:arsenate reductase